MIVTDLLDFYLSGGNYVLLFYCRLIAFPLIEYFAYRYLRKPYLTLQDGVSNGWAIFAVMTMLYYLLLVVMINYPSNIMTRLEAIPACILVLILMFFTYMTIFIALYRQLQVYRRQQSEQILKEQKNSLTAQLENQQRIRKMKHDMKAYTVTLSGLLASGKNDEALGYLKNIESEMDAVLRHFCANPYIDAVLSHYFQNYQELGLTLKLDIQIGDEELPYMELCQILTNSLENAYEALKAVDVMKREASMQMKYSGEYLIIRVKNSCSPELRVKKGKLPVTGKKESGHGFGLKTIQEAAEKLDGEMDCYTEKGQFILDVMVKV